MRRGIESVTRSCSITVARLRRRPPSRSDITGGTAEHPTFFSVDAEAAVPGMSSSPPTRTPSSSGYRLAPTPAPQLYAELDIVTSSGESAGLVWATGREAIVTRSTRIPFMARAQF